MAQRLEFGFSFRTFEGEQFRIACESGGHWFEEVVQRVIV